MVGEGVGVNRNALLISGGKAGGESQDVGLVWLIRRQFYDAHITFAARSISLMAHLAALRVASADPHKNLQT